MIRIWELLWHGCWHKWEYNSTQKIFEKEGDALPVSNRILYKCPKCNRIKGMNV